MAIAIPWLEEVVADGATAGFERGEGTFFLEVHDASDAEEGLHEGDRLAVSADTDAEPGDLVVWWMGKARTQALARVGDDFALRAVAGFPGPPEEGGNPLVRGVVVGRLRRL